jgi:hypothetical protein
MLSPGPSFARFFVPTRLLGLGLAFAPALLRAASGAWTTYYDFGYGEYAGSMEFTPDGQSLWLASTVSLGALNPDTGNPAVRTSLRLLDLASGGLTYFPYLGLDNAAHDSVLRGLALTKTGYPLLLQSTWALPAGHQEPDHSPYFYTYDPAAGQWSPSILPSGEEGQWPGTPSNVVRDDAGDLLVCGNHHVLVSADGATWTQRAELLNFCAPPPPYQPAYGAGGQPAWLPSPQLLTNQPLFQPNGPGWQTGLVRTPWGELFTGGEQGSYFHSLDNGVTWRWFDPLMLQPIRDTAGRPLYRNPNTFRLSQTFHAEATGDGEIILNCKNNLGHHFFLWTSTGQLVTADAGLPAAVGVVEPGITQHFLTHPASGETYMVTRWSNQSSNANATPTSPTGRFVDFYRWDGTSWTLIAPPDFFECAAPNLLIADATGVITGANFSLDPLQHSLIKWTSDTTAAPPPQVSITGGDSATAAPAVTLSAATGRATLQLAATASAAHVFSAQWSARGPGPVLFDDARAISPRASFSVVGDYVLNLRATDLTTGAHRGTSVIVHVRPAPGGAAPAITTQPANTVIAASGSSAFSLTVAASGPGPFTYQWKRDGRDVIAPSARTATLTGVATAADIGATFHCIVGNPHGTVASHTALLGHAPVIVASPLTQTVAAGQNAVFGVAARGAGPLTWQWRFNGAPVANATRAAFAASAPGAYSVDVTNVFGTVTSAAAALTNGTPGQTTPLQLLPGDSNAPSGGDAYLNNGTPVAAVYPMGQPIPLAVERRPYGYGPVFIRWDVTGLGAGRSATFAGGTNTDPQTVLTLTGAGQTTAVRVTAIYKDAATLPFHALSVVNGYGTGEYREAWNYVANASAGAPAAAIEALPAPPGMAFDVWTGDAAFADAHAALTTATLSAARATVTANYLAAIAAWRKAKFGANASDPLIAGDTADPDGDGRVNFLEYALGLDPLANDASAAVTAALPALAPNPAGTALEFTFVRDLAASDVTYQVQVSTDLATWTDASRFSAVAGDLPDTAASTLVSRTTASGKETITVRDTVSLGAATKRFFRLKLILTP